MIEMYCPDGRHEWEDIPSEPTHPGAYACNKCIANAYKVGDQMVVIMCTRPGCTNPAWRIQMPEEIWVCDHHYVGIIIG